MLTQLREAEQPHDLFPGEKRGKLGLGQSAQTDSDSRRVHINALISRLLAGVHQKTLVTQGFGGNECSGKTHVAFGNKWTLC